MQKLTDQEAHDLAMQIAVGRSAVEMGPLLHAAHEAVLMDSERSKHAAVNSAVVAGTAKGVKVRADGLLAFDPFGWDALKTYLLDGGGTSHADMIAGAALTALLNDDQEDFEFQLRLLLKATLARFPHIKQAITNLVSPQVDPLGGKKKP
jgi:hypothetical protein